jgi:uncharacterized glyoxalase superfamily protein PhnB
MPVEDANAAPTFGEAVFGASLLGLTPGEDGGAMHAECRIGDGVVMVGEASGPPAMRHLKLEDTEAAFDRAVANGAEVIEPMMEKGDGDRRRGVRAPKGTRCFPSRQVEGGSARAA